MHFLLVVAMVLAVTGIVLVLVAIAQRGWARIIFGLLGATALGLTFSIWALLRFAEPTVCVQLGGESGAERIRSRMSERVGRKRQ